MNHIGLICELAQLADGLPRNPRRSQTEIAPHLMHTVRPYLDRRLAGVVRKRENLTQNAMPPTTFAKLINDLFHATHGLWQIYLEEVQYL